MSTIKNPLVEDENVDTMSNVADVLEFLKDAVLNAGDNGLSETAASGMFHILNCCTRALKGSAE